MLSNARVQAFVETSFFVNLAIGMIILNAVLTGIQVTTDSQEIEWVQEGILGFFVVEIIARFIGRTSTKDYFTDGWNYFDVAVVAVSFIPDDVMGGANASVIRTLRVLRLLRILHRVEELRLITSVLLKSMKSLGYSGVLFFIFMYVYAVMGVSLFKSGNFEAAPEWTGNPNTLDPYGSIGEAMFTLFRILTGEDWTDLRYNLLKLEPNIDHIVTVFHVSWMILSGFLLVNLVVGAVVNNYDLAMQEVRAEDKRRLEEEQGD